MIADIKRYSEPQHPVVYSDKYWTVYEEVKPFGSLLHCYVHEWSKTAWEQIQQVWCFIVGNTTVPLYVIAPNEKCKKFCHKLGFVSIDTVHDRQGEYKGEFMEFVGVIE
jgi:hypothetical protein